MKRVLMATMAAALTAGAAQAAEWPDTPAQLAGQWTFTPASEGPEVCRFTLGSEETIGGWTLDIPKSCEADFPAIVDAAAWSVDPTDGAIRITDSLRKLLVRFERVPIGGYGANDVNMSMDRYDPDAKPLTPEQVMTGVWKITGIGGGAQCSFRLTSDAAGKAGMISVQPGCGGEWARRSWARWTLRGKELVLYSRSNEPQIAFEQQDLFTYQRRNKVDESRGWHLDLLFFSKVID